MFFKLFKHGSHFKMSCLKTLRKFIRDTRRPSDIYASLRMLLLFGLCFGLLPFEVCSNRGLRACFFGYFNVIARILLYSVIYLYGIAEDLSMLTYFHISDVSRFTDSLRRFHAMFAILLVLSISLLRRQQFRKLIEAFELIERLGFGVGIAFLHSVSARWINYLILRMLFCTIGYILFTRFCILQRNDVSPMLVPTITFYSPHIIVCGIVVLHGVALYKIREYLRALNKVLKNLAAQWENPTVKSMTNKQRSLQCLDSFSMYTIVTKNSSETIQKSMEIHHLICEAASTANKYFTYQLLTIISIAFLISVFDAYYVLETLLGKSKRGSKFKTVEFVTFFSCQMILYLIAIISVVEGSNRAIKKSEKTGSIVHSLLNKAKNPEVKETLQQFSMQLMHMKINFTAAGLFNIDRSLYFTISGALTTYLIILLQFTSNTATTPGTNAAVCLHGINTTQVPVS